VLDAPLKIRHSRDMKTSATYADAHLLTASAGVSLLVKSAGSIMGEALHHSLLAAGLRLVCVPTVYEAVVEAERTTAPTGPSKTRSAPAALRHVVVDIDFFGQQEFRLFPLVRREWPTTLIVAYHSAGFDYKGRLAEMLGADFVLGNPEDVARFAESLAAPVVPPPAARSKPEPAAVAPAPVPTAIQLPAPAAPSPVAETIAPPSEPVSPPAGPEAKTEEVPAEPSVASTPPAPSASVPESSPAPTSMSSAAALAALAAVVSKMGPAGPYMPSTTGSGAAIGALSSAAAQAAANAAGDNPQAPGQSAADPSEDMMLVDGEVVGTIELTEEELRLLLGEEDEG
jgi:hypothetical protein